MSETTRAGKRGGRRSTTRVPGVLGDGWGGPPKGAGHAPFEPGNQVAAGPHDMHSTEEKAERLRRHIYKLAESAEREETQLAASIAWLNRVEGMPVARNLNINQTGPVVEDTRPSVESLIEQSMAKDGK